MHPHVAFGLSSLANVLQDLGGAENLARARENFARAEGILRAALGDEHPYTRQVATSFAGFRAKYGDS